MTIESHATSLSMVEKITSNGYVYAELWPNPNDPNLDYRVNTLYRSYTRLLDVITRFRVGSSSV